MNYQTGTSFQSIGEVQKLKHWTDEAITALDLQWDGERIVFSTGAKYLPGGHPKMIQEPGRSRDLFPKPEGIPGDVIWLVEGEPDVVSMWSIGLYACGVPGAACWRPEWAERFKGKHVAVVGDCDMPGVKWSTEAAHDLLRYAKTVRLLRLDGDDGYDVGDLISQDGDAKATLRSLVVNTPPLPPRLRVRTLATLKDTVASTNWLWHGMVAEGAITVLAGLPKVGKSTLVFGLMAADQEFLGLPVSNPGSLILSEERDASLAEKARMFDVDSPHVLCRYDVKGMRWPEVIEESVYYCESHDLGLLVVDTFDKWGEHDENVPSQVVQSLDPLIWAAGKGLGVLLLHHQRKAPGLYGEAVRGSNALTGGVDVVVELEREADARILKCVSRFRETPESLRVRMKESDDFYCFDVWKEAEFDIEDVIDRIFMDG